MWNDLDATVNCKFVDLKKIEDKNCDDCGFYNPPIEYNCKGWCEKRKAWAKAPSENLGCKSFQKDDGIKERKRIDTRAQF